MALPVLQALVLADHVYQDRHTGKNIIAGTFNRLWAKEFPTQLDRTTFAFICLTEVQGKNQLVLRYVDLQNNKALLETNIDVESDDPLASVERGIEVPNLPMPHTGTYTFEVLCNDELLGALRIIVDQVEESKGKQHE